MLEARLTAIARGVSLGPEANFELLCALAEACELGAANAIILENHMFLKKVKAAAMKITDAKAALDCISYILDNERDDYYEQAADNGVTRANWEKKWDKLHHVYASALKAIGDTPDVDSFEEK
jgi:hypothetical protein